MSQLEAGQAEHEFSQALAKLYGRRKYEPAVVIKTRPSDPKREFENKRQAEAARRTRKTYVMPRRKAPPMQRPAPILTMGGRKSAAVIQYEVQRDFPAPPVATGKGRKGRRDTSDDNDDGSAAAAARRGGGAHRAAGDLKKRALQEHMAAGDGGVAGARRSRAASGENNGDAANAVPMAGPQRARRAREQRRQRVAAAEAAQTEEERLFDVISAEIDDRRAFLDDMRALGDGKRYERQITAEISDRVKELTRLDEIIAEQQALR